MFEFEWFYLIGLLPIPALFYRQKQVSASNGISIKVPFFQALNALSLVGTQQKIFSLNRVLLWLAWLALVLAVMKPIWIDEGIKLPIKGRDVILAIDLSGSMRERDFALNNRRVDRLTVVKAAALEFIKARKNDRLGLVVFGDEAFLYAPLTFDKSLIEQYLLQSKINMAGGRWTAVGDAIVLAVKHFADNKQKQKPRSLILLTDGRDNNSKVAIAQATKIAKQQNVRIHTIGLGRGIDGGVLRRIAEQTGGLYFQANNTKLLYKIYQQLDRLERNISEHKIYRPKQDLFHYPLMIFLLSIVLLVFRQCR